MRLTLRVTAHELPMTLVMLGVVLAGRAPLACAAAPVLLVAIAIGYAPLARTRAWAQAHLLDLGAMAMVMALPLWSATAGHTGATGVHVHGSGGLGSAAGILQLVVIAAWAAVRGGMLRQGRHRTAFSVATGAVCVLALGGMLLL